MYDNDIIQGFLATECKRVSVAMFHACALSWHRDVYDLIYLCMGTGRVYQPLH